jgi:hypothetical protein
MNASVEKILTEFEVSRGFGSVEIIYCNGVAASLHVKKTHKLTSNFAPNSRRENRGNESGNTEPETR